MHIRIIKFIILTNFLSIALICCKNTNKISKETLYKIQYLDEYVLHNDSIFEGSKIGGLSGIEYDPHKNVYYLACDDSKNPRFYQSSIAIENNQFKTVSVQKLVTIKKTEQQLQDAAILDLEAIRVFNENKLIFTSEGSLNHDMNPSIFTTDTLGNYQNRFELPHYFLAHTSKKNKPRHNGVFEGLSSDINNKGYWAAMELPLLLDGKEPSIHTFGAAVRITHFDTNTYQADYQFAYTPDKLSKDPKGKFGINGITALIQLSTHMFLIVEREYIAGYKNRGNHIKIYLADIDNATNTLSMDILAKEKYTIAKKTLLFDFESIRNKLTDAIVDNIEGITIGPKLSNGNQSLILISDNNFNPSAIQINQLILLELIKKQ